MGCPVSPTQSAACLKPSLAARPLAESAPVIATIMQRYVGDGARAATLTIADNDGRPA